MLVYGAKALVTTLVETINKQRKVQTTRQVIIKHFLIALTSLLVFLDTILPTNQVRHTLEFLIT